MFRGDVTGGEILNVNDVQYCVSLEMEIDHGGSGPLHFTGVLDHGPFPPTIAGFVTQLPGVCPIL